jgi:hypothetical protein
VPNQDPRRELYPSESRQYRDGAGFFAGFNAGYGSANSDTDTLLSDATIGNPLLSTDATSSTKARTK